MSKSKTAMAIKKNNRSLLTWCKEHKLTYSAVNDIIHKRSYYAEMIVPKDWTNGYAILQRLINEGYGKELIEDGWDITLIDPNKAVETTTRASYKVNSVSLNTDVVSISWAVCELGDTYTCNVFISPTPDAGPVAVLFMMEKNARSTRKACEFLNHRFINYKFYVESSDVITIWTE